MINKIGKILCIIGLALITLGCIIFVVSSKDKENNGNEKILVDTTNKKGDIIDKTDYEFFEVNLLKSVDMYNSTNDGNYKYTFQVPKELNEYYLDDYKKDFRNDYLEVDAYVMENWDLDNFNEILKLQFGEYFTKLNYSYNDTIKIGNYDAVYIKHEALSDIIEVSEDKKNAYEEKFAVVVNLKSHYFVLVYRYKQRKTDDNMLTELINGITIVETNSLPSYCKEESDNMVCSIKQNKDRSYEHGYNISYKLSSKDFQINNDKKNSINSTYLINAEQSTLLSYELYMTYEDDVQVEIINSINEKDNELLSYKEIKKEYNGKKLTQINMTYNDKISKKTRYYTVFIDKIENNYALLISIDSEKQLDDKTLKSYLNYVIEEY